MVLLKALLCTNVLNDVTAAPCSVSFSQLPAAKKNTKNGAAVTSLRTFVHSSAFTSFLIHKIEKARLKEANGEEMSRYCHTVNCRQEFKQPKLLFS